MKRATVFALALCILLCSCTANPTDEEKPSYTSTDPENSLEISADAEAVEWPTAEEIRATIDAEQVEVYWLAEEVPIPEQMACYSVAALDLEAFWNTLSEKLENATARVDSGSLYITDGAEQIQAILEALEDATGTAFTEVNVADDDTTIQHRYAQTVDDVILDTEGYTPDGGAEVMPGTKVDVLEDGRVSIQDPLILGQQTQIVNKDDLVQVEDIQTLCTTYYQIYGLPCVAVVTGLDLVYYGAGEELLPAWCLDITWYPSENGHRTSQMIDGTIGVYLRQ